MSKQNKSETTPSRIALCVKLANCNHMAGVLLYQIVFWKQYVHAKIPGVSGEWIANDREWWMREAQLSSDQYDRTILKLEKWNLIERRQWWFGRRNILFVRATKVASDYVMAATTWQAAAEFVGNHAGQNEYLKISKSADQCSAMALISNGISTIAKPGSAMALSSNNSENLQDYYKEKLNGAHPASPSCAKETNFQKKEIPGEDKIGIKQTHFAKNLPMALPFAQLEKTGSTSPSLNDLIAIWAAVTKDHYGNHACGSLNAKEMGIMAMLFHTLFGNAAYGDENLQSRSGDIIAYAIKHWSQLKMDKLHPNLKCLIENLGAAIAPWHEAGRPSYLPPKAT